MLPLPVRIGEAFSDKLKSTQHGIGAPGRGSEPEGLSDRGKKETVPAEEDSEEWLG